MSATTTGVEGVVDAALPATTSSSSSSITNSVGSAIGDLSGNEAGSGNSDNGNGMFPLSRFSHVGPELTRR